MDQGWRWIGWFHFLIRNLSWDSPGHIKYFINLPFDFPAVPDSHFNSSCASPCCLSSQPSRLQILVGGSLMPGMGWAAEMHPKTAKYFSVHRGTANNFASTLTIAREPTPMQLPTAIRMWRCEDTSMSIVRDRANVYWITPARIRILT